MGATTPTIPPHHSYYSGIILTIIIPLYPHCENYAGIIGAGLFLTTCARSTVTTTKTTMPLLINRKRVRNRHATESEDAWKLRLVRDRARTRGAVSLPRQPDSEKHAFLDAVLKTGHGIQPQHCRKLNYATSKSNGAPKKERLVRFSLELFVRKIPRVTAGGSVSLTRQSRHRSSKWAVALVWKIVWR